MEWSIQQIARIAGTTSRTLRHYAELGLVQPSRIGSNGYRYYDQASLVRLQRVLLLRELGLGLQQIFELLDRQDDEAAALSTHLTLLRREQERLGRKIKAVEHTMESLKGGYGLMPEEMFAGFDHTRYREEVEQRWGKDAYARSDAWWRNMGDPERKEWKARLEDLNRDWITAARAEAASPDSDAAQELAGRHVAWLLSMPGTPGEADTAGYIRGLADMYATDPRFAANYGGLEGAVFVRDALLTYLDQQ